MISGSIASLPHSEAVFSSAAFSSSFASSSSVPRYAAHSRRGSGAPPLRSVDATEVPHDTSNNSNGTASLVGSPQDEDIEVDVDDTRREQHHAEPQHSPDPGSAIHSAVVMTRQQRTGNTESEEADVISDAHSTQSSASSSSSSYPREDAGDSPMVAPPSSPPPVISPEKLLALLSAAQVEAALELYVQRGGVRVQEVPALLATLPWTHAPAASSSAPLNLHAEPSTAPGTSSSGGDDDDDDENYAAGEKEGSHLLDPEGWLCAVAVAAAAAAASVPSDTQQQASAASGTEAAAPPPPPPPPPPQERSKAEAQLHLTGSDHYESSLFGQSSGGISFSHQHLPATASNGREAPPASAVVKHRRGSHEGQQQRPPTLTGRKLAFIDEVDDDGFSDLAGSHVRASLPELPPRPPSSSLRSVPSPAFRASPSLPSQVVVLQQPHLTRPATANSTSNLLHATKNRRPPRSSALPGSPFYSSVSPEAQNIAEVSQLTRSISPSSTSAAEEVGMRVLFQQCLRTPMATATAMLSESDWVSLVEELRREGHHKLPPQAILDDVTHTITEDTRREGRDSGLNLADFTRILHTQLDEVRHDLTANAKARTSAAASSAASMSMSDTAVAVEFPASPKYLFTLPTSAAASSNNIAAGAHRASISFASSFRRPSTKGSGWRVLPTWCMSLAGLFPVEMSTVCPMPVVRYLRSVGLMNAVLEALVQRLEFEVEATTDVPAPRSALTVVQPLKEGRPDLKLTVKETEPSTFSMLTTPSPVGVSGFVWPPRANSLTSFSMNGTGASLPARPTSSVVVTSASHDGVSWKEGPEWQPMMLAAAAAGDGLFVPNDSAANVSVEKVESHSSVPVRQRLSASRVSSASAQHSTGGSRYHEERPVDEISASVVARAKARRLMDSLRRNTVPINRYECFARVEHEDEAVQEPLCFITAAELKRTLDDSAEDDDGDGDEGDASHDSDAMSDLIGTLTYDPAAAAAAAEKKAEDERQQRHALVNGEGGRQLVELSRVQSADHARVVRPPQLPRVSAAKALPNVFAGATRASVMLRARTASSAGDGAAARVASVRGNSLGFGEAPHRPLPLAPAPPPPPVPGMYRMTGVLLGALPKQQEEALVERLSHPAFDPRSMGLRAASANAAATAAATAVGRSTSPTKAAARSKQGNSVARAQSAGVRPPPTSVYLQSEGRASPPQNRHAIAPAHQHNHHHHHYHHQQREENEGGSGGDGDDSLSLSDDSVVRFRTPSPQPPQPHSTQLSASPAQSLSIAPHLSLEQHRGFYYFDVPPVLIANPLSTVAAARAAAQVMQLHSPAKSPASSSSAPSPHKPQPPRREEDTVRARRGRGRGERLHRSPPRPRPPHPPSSTPSKPKRRRHPRATTAASGGRSRSAAPRQTSARGAARRALSTNAPRTPLQTGPQRDPHAAHDAHHTRGTSSQVRKARKGRGGASAPAATHVRHLMSGAEGNTAYASEVPLAHRGHGRGHGKGHDGDTRAFVTHAAQREEEEADVSTNADGSGRSPPPVPMSLYERRLLRKLQRAYTVECAGGH